jgi:hypothetical protein
MMKWKFQFSLSSLLWLTVCIALLLTSVLMYRRMCDAERRKTEAEAEAAVVRKAAGYLVVGDQKLVHAHQVPTHEPFSWKWRLFLPSGHHFRINVASGDIPQQGMPNIKPLGLSIAARGEIAVTADIHQCKDKNWEMILHYQNEKLDLAKGIDYTYPVQGYEITIPISTSVTEAFRENPGSECSGFGLSGTEVSDPDKTIVLLRNRQMEKTGDKKWTRTKDLVPGIMIWLEEKR